MTTRLLLAVLAFALTPATGLRAAVDLFAGAVPQGLAIADFDRDGRPDIAVANAFDDTVTIHRQSAPGVFTLAQTIPVGMNPASPSNFPRALVVADIDHDGAPDLIVLCSGNFLFGQPPSVQTLLNRGDGLFVVLPAGPVAPVVPQDLFPVHFAVGHFSNSPLPGLAVAQLRDQSIRLMPGNGAGAFAPGPVIALPARPQFLLVEDIDGDGLDDLFVAAEASLLLVRQTAPGTFAAPVALPLPVGDALLTGLAAGDFDGDGRLDLVAADANNRVLVLSDLDSAGQPASSFVLTDPSLDEPSAVAFVSWDGDARDDLLVANRLGATVTVFLSAGGTQVLSVGARPRRVALADLDANGRLDLVTANEGDVDNAANPDVSIRFNADSPDHVAVVESTDADLVAGTLGPRLLRPRAVAHSLASRVWVLDNARRSIQELNPSPTVNANPSARFGARIDFTDEVAGMVFTNALNGFALGRYSGVLSTLNANTGAVTPSATVAESPGQLGFGGLAYNAATGTFFASDPSGARILRFNASGAVLGSFAVDPPVHDLAWSASNARLFGVSPGSTSVRAWQADGTPDASRTFDMAASAAIFRRGGLAGITAVPNNAQLRVLASDGLLALVNTSGTLAEICSVAPASGGAALTFDAANNELHLLGAELHVGRLKLPDLTEGALLSLWPALQADPTFVPVGIAWDPVAGNLLVSGAGTTTLARFRRNGQFVGFENSAPPANTRGLTGGIAFADDGALYWRARFAARAGAVEIPLPATLTIDLDIRGGRLAVGTSNPGEVLLVPLNGTDTAVVATVPLSGDHAGIALLDDETLLGFGSSPTAPLQTFTFDIPDNSSVPSWSLYGF
ncbi:MAG: VCBS repeat-containing protein [Candidatus Sumerlaeia bacterium]|nr:VCBS repeat-containing protein [Candidatus Sumerlaeia bacterium]